MDFLKIKKVRDFLWLRKEKSYDHANLSRVLLLFVPAALDDFCPEQFAGSELGGSLFVASNLFLVELGPE